MTEKKSASTDDVKKYDENPYDPEKKRPEDIVRLFYQNNVPIIPVITKRGTLIGILKKEDVISELSDIERIEKLAIDGFITKLAGKMPLDSLLNYGKVREFIVINMFGEVQGKWSRLQLFAAAETYDKGGRQKDEMEKQKEDQILEWMIYLILEHIPRALYAVNSKSKTIFYNSHFEEIYRKKFNKDVDTAFVEKALKDTNRNQLISGKSAGLYFLNEDIGILYEKVPMMSKQKRVGFLLFCLKDADKNEGTQISGIDLEGKSLADLMETVERQILVDSIHRQGELGKAAKSLKVSRKALQGKVKKHDIKV